MMKEYERQSAACICVDVKKQRQQKQSEQIRQTGICHL